MEISKTNFYNLYNIKIIVIIFGVYFLYFFSEPCAYKIFLNIFIPLFWLIIYAYYKITHPFKSNIYLNEKNSKKTKWLIIIIAIYFSFYFILGIFIEYAKNPLTNFVLNFWVYFVFIIPQEYTRNFLVRDNRKNKAALFLIFFLFLIIETDPMYFINNVSDPKRIASYILYVLIPLIFSNLLLTYMAIKSSYINNLIYRFALSISIYIAPFQPGFPRNLNLILTLSLIAIIYFRFEIINTKDSGVINSRKKTRKQKIINYSAALVEIIFGTIIVMFFSGNLYSYFPAAIMSDSMQTYMSIGDLAIIKKIDDKNKIENLKISDVLAYKLGNKMITHRIIDIKRSVNDNNLYFITKGDNNRQPDPDKVYSNQVIGTIEYTLKYLGYPSVVLKNMNL